MQNRHAMTARERDARRAIDRLGPIRLSAFFDAIRGDEQVMAVKLAAEHLDADESLEALFFDGEEGGFHLHVKGRGRRFTIAFGYAGGMVGDGAEWAVEFDVEGRVVRCEPGSIWIA